MNKFSTYGISKLRQYKFILSLLLPVLFVASHSLFASTFLDSIESQIDDRISGIPSPSASLPVFTTRATSTGTWVRNTSAWTNNSTDIDWTGIVAWNSSGGYLYGGTLISPRHLIMASHYTIPNGSTVVFVANDNTKVIRTITNQVNLGNDITVGILDSAVPSSITYYPLPPTMSDMASRIGITEYSDTTENQVSSYNIPLISFDQEKKASIHLVSYISDTTIAHGTYSTTVSSEREPFSHPTVPGDSGNPMFILIDDNPILVSVHTYSTQGTYYGYGTYQTQINSAMDSLSGSNEYDASIYSISSYAIAAPSTPDLLSAYDTNIDGDNITSTTTPKVEIPCVNGLTVKLYSNNSEVSSGSCSSSIYSYTFSGLVDGQYTINAVQVSGSSVSATSTSLSLTVDTTAPSNPASAPDLLEVSDDGTLSNDNFTSISSPKFRVPCTLGNTVDLYIDNTVNGSSTCTDSNAIIETDTPVSYGVKSITFKEKDPAGNTTSASPSLVVNFNTEQSTLLNIDGTLDTTFNAGGTGANSSITSMKYLPSSGKYLIAGNFTSYNTSLGTTGVGRIARLNSDGTLDTTFNSGGGGANAVIGNMELQSDGKIIILGNFTSYNTSLGTTTVGRIARLNSDGTLDTTFNSGGAGLSSGYSGCTLSAPDSCDMIVDSQDRILLTVHNNTYTYNGSTPAHKYLIRLLSNGTLDSSFLSGGNGLGSQPGKSRLLELESGKYMLAAYATTLGYHDAVNGTTTGQIFRLNENGTRDTSFTDGSASVSMNVLGFEMYEDRDTNNLYFSTNAYHQGATYNGSPINTVLLKVSADGSTVDSSFSTGNPQDGSKVSSLNYLGDGRFLIGFGTSALSSNLSWPGLTVPQATAPSYMSLIVNKNGVDSTYTNKSVSRVYDTHIDSLGRLVIAGNMSTYDGVTVGHITRITKATSPSISKFVSMSQNNTYKIGDTINIAAIMSEPVRPNSEINVTLDTGVSVALTTSATSTSLTGSYVVTEDDTTNDLLVSSISSASVVDTLGNTTTSFTVPSDNIDDNADIIVDGVRPTANVPVLKSDSDSGSSSSDGITNDITPSFTVSCSSGESVSLYNTSTFIASSTCSGSSIDITAPVLSAGTYNVVNVVTSANGNHSATSTPALVVILSSSYSGSTPNTPDLSSSSDTGISSTDNYTSDTTLTVSGACTSGETVLLSIDGDLPQSITCNSSLYTYTTSTLSEGSHNIVAAFMDVAGNVSQSSDPLLVEISSHADDVSVSTSAVQSTVASVRSGSVMSLIQNYTKPSITPGPTNIPMKPSILDTIKEKIKTPETPDKTCTPYLIESLVYGRSNSASEVTKLQTFLNNYNNANIETNGIFDLATKKAVENFQTKYARHILYPWSLTKPTGNVLKTTRAKINAMVCASTYGCPYFTEYHKLGDSSSDIKKVKSFLNILNPEASLNTDSPTYDTKTKAQVVDFQTRYKDSVLKPWGLKNATALWYKTTRASANEIMECNEVLSL